MKETSPVSACIDIKAAAGSSAMSDRPAENVNDATAARTQIKQFFFYLETHLIAEHGEMGAVVRAHMIFDAYGPGRNIDPQILFKEDSEGDAWAEAISHLIF